MHSQLGVSGVVHQVLFEEVLTILNFIKGGAGTLRVYVQGLGFRASGDLALVLDVPGRLG